MFSVERATLLRCLVAVLRPVIAFCLRHNITHSELSEVAKVAFVQEATKQIKKTTAKINISRLCVACGLNRKEVVRILDGKTKQGTASFVIKTIGQWMGDKKFLNKAGKPRVLIYDGENSEFDQLVRSVCSDVHPGTVLFELLRINAVEKTKNGLKLVRAGYNPKGDVEACFELYGQDSMAMLQSIEENSHEDTRPPNLHITTSFDKVDLEALQQLRQWLFSEGNKFHEMARAHIAKFDLDLNPKPGKVANCKVTIGSFSLCADNNQASNSHIKDTDEDA